MDPAYVVLLIATTIAIVAIAGYLIAIALILKHVVDRLTTILGAVQAVTDTAQPVGAIVDDINRDLEGGRKYIEDAVERLEASREPVGAPAQPSPRHERHGVDHVAGVPGGGTATAAPPPAAPDADTHPDSDLEDAPEAAPRGRGWWNR